MLITGEEKTAVLNLTVLPNQVAVAFAKFCSNSRAAGLIQTQKPQGRVMSPKGRKLMQEVAGDLAKEMVKTVPELKKYQGE